jgi:hypothetical protein
MQNLRIKSLRDNKTVGFKSPLAYSSSFYFICRKAGVERKYMMYEGDEINRIDLLYEQSTTEPNGVKIIIPVKYNDRWEFIKKMKEQLAYFEGVYFHTKGIGDSIDNDFKIYRNDIFQTSELANDNALHICLDNVYYPLDFAKLGIPRLQYGVALRFNLTDGLFPTPNRESIRYTQESKKVILDKIEKFADYMINKYNESVKDTDNIKAIFNYYNSAARYVSIENISYDVNQLTSYSKIAIVAPKLKGVDKLDLKHLCYFRANMFSDYRIRFVLQNNRFTEIKGKWGQELSINGLDNYEAIYTYDERIGSNKKIYIRSLHNSNGRIAFIKKVEKIPLFPKQMNKQGYDNYFALLNLSKHPKSDWRDIIKEYNYIISLFLKDVKDFDKIDIPQSWFDARKVKKANYSGSTGRSFKLEGELVYKQAEDLLKYVDGKTCKFVPAKLKLEDLYKLPFLFIYGTYEQQTQLDEIYNISKKQKIKIISLSQREYKLINELELHNVISIEKFMVGKNKPFRRLVTGYLINEMISNNSYVFNKIQYVDKISNSLAEKLKVMRDYERIHSMNAHSEVYKAMLDVAKTHNLYDETVYPEYLECKAILEKLKFLNPILEKFRGYGNEDGLISALTDLFKYYKTKVNFDLYHMRLNEDLPLEAVLTEETISELTAVD